MKAPRGTFVVLGCIIGLGLLSCAPALNRDNVQVTFEFSNTSQSALIANETEDLNDFCFFVSAVGPGISQAVPSEGSTCPGIGIHSNFAKAGDEVAMEVPPGKDRRFDILAFKKNSVLSSCSKKLGLKQVDGDVLPTADGVQIFSEHEVDIFHFYTKTGVSLDFGENIVKLNAVPVEKRQDFCAGHGDGGGGSTPFIYPYYSHSSNPESVGEFHLASATHAHWTVGCPLGVTAYKARIHDYSNSGNITNDDSIFHACANGYAHVSGVQLPPNFENYHSSGNNADLELISYNGGTEVEHYWFDLSGGNTTFYNFKDNTMTDVSSIIVSDGGMLRFAGGGFMSGESSSHRLGVRSSVGANYEFHDIPVMDPNFSPGGGGWSYFAKDGSFTAAFSSGTMFYSGSFWDSSDAKRKFQYSEEATDSCGDSTIINLVSLSGDWTTLTQDCTQTLAVAGGGINDTDTAYPLPGSPPPRLTAVTGYNIAGSGIDGAVFIDPGTSTSKVKVNIESSAGSDQGTMIRLGRETLDFSGSQRAFVATLNNNAVPKISVQWFQPTDGNLPDGGFIFSTPLSSPKIELIPEKRLVVLGKDGANMQVRILDIQHYIDNDLGNSALIGAGSAFPNATDGTPAAAEWKVASANFYPAWSGASIKVEFVKHLLPEFNGGYTPSSSYDQGVLANHLLAGGLAGDCSTACYPVIYRSPDGGQNWYLVYKGISSTDANLKITDATTIYLRNSSNGTGSAVTMPGFAVLEKYFDAPNFLGRVLIQQGHGL